MKTRIKGRPGIQIPIPPRGVVFCGLITDVVSEDESASSTGVLVLGWALVVRDR